MGIEQRERAMMAVLNETVRQDLIHGADRNITPAYWFAILGEEVGEVAREVQTADAVKFGVEVAQVAAVAVQMLEWLLRTYPQQGQQALDRIAEMLKAARVDELAAELEESAVVEGI
jgi:hypothetical protein